MLGGWRLLVVCLVLLGGCTPPVHQPPSARPDQHYDTLKAGIAEVDITPPPGLTLYGWGPESRISEGVRLRLRCQAFVLASGDETIALLPCDLHSASLELQRKVAQGLYNRKIPIGASRLFLMATHTHGGPGHYFESRRYSGSFSSYEPGYDPAVSDFLAQRLTDVVATAYKALEPACLGWGEGRIRHLTRNRSFVPFFANPDAKQLLEQGGVLEGYPRRGAAVDQTLSVLRIDKRGEGGSCQHAKPLGVFAAFGMHPTAIPMTYVFYHGDVFGFATREVEACMRNGERTTRAGSCDQTPAADGPPFIAGIGQGIAGDVAPAVDFQAPREARRLGRALAHKILRVHAGIETSAHAELRRVYRELRLPGAKVGSVGHLCSSPSVGTSAAAGSEEGATRFRIIPEANEGRRLRREDASGCHGRKLRLIPPEGHADECGLQFPTTVPIGLLQIGDRYLATIPAEPTTATGRRIVEEIEKHAGHGATLVSLTNSYILYVSTREEYAFQHYEGGETLYGPNSAEFFRLQFGCLAEALSKNDFAHQGCDQPFEYNQLNPVVWDPKPVVSRLRLDWEEAYAEPKLRSLAAECSMRDGLPAWNLTFSGPGRSALAACGGVTIEVVDASGKVIDDDQGSSIELRYDGDFWRSSWMPCLSSEDPLCRHNDHEYRIVVKSQGFPAKQSELFELAPRCLAPPLQQGPVP